MRTAFSLPARKAAPLFALAVFLCVLAFDAAAARLGVMTVRSAQGQPFDAEIALADWDETSERPRVVPVEPLRIRLAGREELVWPTAWLDTSRVGNTVVRIRTEFEIPEPAFELTLRIESDRGQMVITYPITLRPAGQSLTGGAERIRGVVALDDVPGKAVTVRPTPPVAAPQRAVREDPIADLLQGQQRIGAGAGGPLRIDPTDGPAVRFQSRHDPLKLRQHVAIHRELAPQARAPADTQASRRLGGQIARIKDDRHPRRIARIEGDELAVDGDAIGGRTRQHANDRHAEVGLGKAPGMRHQP